MIPFYKPWSSGDELSFVADAIAHQGSPRSRYYTEKCEAWLKDYTGSQRAFLTPSCTAALEMAALLLDIQHGDEVIMSSFTFPSMANAFVLRGAVPVFVDIRSDTLNIDERLIEEAITPKTRAIIAMHYGGQACEMDTIMAIADRHDLWVVEDAAHAIGGFYKGRALGSIGHLGAFSFHETKNVQCSEGGALLINDTQFLEAAASIRYNGTDRERFKQGLVPHYSWVSIGSSFIMSELSAAFLWGQLQAFERIQANRRSQWTCYQQRLGLRRDSDEQHAAHIYWVCAETQGQRTSWLDMLAQQGIQASTHYQPLHSAQAGQHYGQCSAQLPITIDISNTLIRLPLWTGMSDTQMNTVLKGIDSVMLR